MKSIFNLNVEKNIYFLSKHEKTEQLMFEDEVKVFWVDAFSNILIGESYACFFAESIESKLSSAIKGDLFFDQSKYISPGILKNKYFILEEFRNSPWILEDDGLQYSLFKTHSEQINKTAYVYNGTGNKIIFEIGEMFSWPDKERFLKNELLELEKNFLSFIADYKPIVKEVIPLEIAEKWLAQAKNLNETIKQNVMKEFSVREK